MRGPESESDCSSSSVWFSEQLCKELESTSSTCHNSFDGKQNLFSELTTIHNKMPYEHIIQMPNIHIQWNIRYSNINILKAQGELL